MWYPTFTTIGRVFHMGCCPLLSFQKKTVLFNPILSTGPVMASARGEGSTKAYGEVTTEARGERTKKCAAQHPARNQVLGKFGYIAWCF